MVFFIVLTVQQKPRLWLVIFLAGAAVSIIAGRFFCGWICPMNTLFRGIQWVCGKLKIKRRPPPRVLSKNWFRYSIVLLFMLL
ncbi:MAG: 4Fe-4S binding protein [Spirochaetia bacterium]